MLTTKVARIIFAIPMLMFGFGHFANADMLASAIYHVGGMPALILNYIAGAGLLLAGIALIINKKVRLASLLLALELFLFIVILHIPKMMGVGPVEFFGDEERMAMEGMVHTFKDMGLMAGALILAGTAEE